MAKRATLPKANELPPWAKTDVAQDFAEGRTNGKAWDWHDGLVAQLAVVSDRKRRQSDQDIETAMRVVASMGLLDFIIQYLSVWCSHWWWGESMVHDD